MQKQRLKQSRKFQLSPQQIQFLSLLQIPLVSLDQRIEEEIEKNPALEEAEKEEESWDEDRSSYYKPKQDQDEKRPIIQERDETLQEHLLKQLPLESLSDKDSFLAEFIIGCLDNNGFLLRDLYSVSEDLLLNYNLDITEPKLSNILKIIQGLEPAGVGGRDLRECLLLQLAAKKETLSIILAKSILKDNYKAFKSKNYKKLSLDLEVKDDALRIAIDEISKLNPKPGNNFSSSEVLTNYITPDFIIENIDDKIKIVLNKKRRWNLKASSYYQGMLSTLKEKGDQEAVSFLKNKLESAQWFVDSLKKREDTLIQTMNCILSLQTTFFISGDFKDLKPMKLMDISQKINLDISTISRVTNSKYIETPFGTFLLKEFFSEAYNKDDGTSISTKVIKIHLQEILDQEDKSSPFTDEELANILDKEGYHIARRTVSKYRETLGYSVARLRKKI